MLRGLLSNLVRLIRWVFTQEIGILIAAALVALSVLAFSSVADEVLEGESDEIDRRIMLWFRSAENPEKPFGPDWLVTTVEEITALGSTPILALITAGVAGFLLLRGSGRSAVFVIVAVVGGTLVTHALKVAFGRERPDIVPHLTHHASHSFPSGHAMLSAVTYLTLGALLAEIEPRKRVKAYVIAAAMTIAAMVGFTRVYLGVHYPTDVAAGWTAGVAWAVTCWGVARWLRLRNESGNQEQPGVASEPAAALSPPLPEPPPTPPPTAPAIPTHPPEPPPS